MHRINLITFIDEDGKEQHKMSLFISNKSDEQYYTASCAKCTTEDSCYNCITAQMIKELRLYGDKADDFRTKRNK